MSSREYIDKQMTTLSKEDWQFIHMAVFDRFKRLDPKPGEPASSKGYKAQKDRILDALMNKAYSGS